MQFYDLHIHSAFSEGESSIEQLAAMTKRLGYAGVCFAEYFEGKEQFKRLKEEIAKVRSKIPIGIFLGFEARSVKELERLAANRKLFDILLVRGGDLKLNRVACETPEVDILTHPEYERYDNGLNDVLAKEAVKNNVAIEINFREILITTKKTRNQVLANMRENVKLAKKYNAPIILCSGSISHWTLRDPLCMQSMAMQLGLTLSEAKDAISKIPESIIENARVRTSGRGLMPGIKVVK